MKKRPGNAIVAIIVGVVALIFFAFAIVYYTYSLLPNMAKSIGEALFGGSSATAQAAVMKPVDCGTTTKIQVPELYLPVIKQAAKRYLGGDEAALIAVISVEAPRFDRTAISGTGAVGLGQFVVPKGPQGAQSLSKFYFQGLPIVRVPRANPPKVTTSEKQAFRDNYPNEGRLQYSPSIFASAHLLGNAVKKYNGDVGKAYAEGYNGSTAIQSNGKMEKENASERVVKIYNSLNTDGGCKALQDTPGKLGEDLRKAANVAF